MSATCKDCATPVRLSGTCHICGEPVFYHDSPADTLCCPGTDTHVKAAA